MGAKHGMAAGIPARASTLALKLSLVPPILHTSMRRSCMASVVSILLFADRTDWLQIFVVEYTSRKWTRLRIIVAEQKCHN